LIGRGVRDILGYFDRAYWSCRRDFGLDPFGVFLKTASSGPRRRTMQFKRKWMVLAAAMVSVSAITVTISVAADEDSPLHKIMEQVQIKNLAITKGTRTEVGFKKDQKTVVTCAEDLAKLAKQAKEYGKDYIKKAKDVSEPQAKWNELMDTFASSSEDLAKVAGKSGATKDEAKKAFGVVKKACADCHAVFRIEAEDF
jgi:cytochrome c556